MVEFIMDFYQLDNMFDLGEWYNNQKFIGYKGIINEKVRQTNCVYHRWRRMRNRYVI